MRQSPAIVDAESVIYRTAQSHRRLRDFLITAERALADVELAERRPQTLCKFCFYINPVRIAGQAMTTRPCGICLEDMHHGNTATNLVCTSCATKHSLCCRCGADSELRTRRSAFAWIKKGRRK